MKKMYRPLIKGTNWALVGISGLLGFSGCDNTGQEMYGVPWASYAIKGTVVNIADGKPVEGIRVDIVTNNPDGYEGHKPESWITTTNAKGEFKLSNTLGSDETLAITDIDGDKNGSFVSDTLKVDYRNAEHIGGGKGWFQGELVATVKAEIAEIKEQ
jgi:putative lipoprotein (rSAM/lipoprotein system)